MDHREDGFREGQERVLQLIATGAALAQVLDCLTLLVEGQCQGVRCAILVLDDQGHVRQVAAPSRPASGEIGASGSTNILSPRGKLLGAVVLYDRKLADGEERVITIVAQLAGIAIERACTEEALLESERRLGSIFDGAGMGISFLDLNDLCAVNTNRALQAMLGSTGEELSCLHTFAELTAPEDRERDEQLHRQAREGGRSEYRQEKHFILRDGRHVWANVIFMALPDESGQPRYVLAMHEDITEQKVAEAALRETEERGRAVLRAIPDLMFLVRGDGTYVDCHAKSSEELLLPPEQLIGSNMRDVLPPQIATQFLGAFERASHSAETQMIEYDLTVNGKLRHSEARVVRSGGDRFLVIVRDVTHRRRAEDALVASEARYRNVIETQSEMICRCLPDCTITFVNEAYCRFLGRTPEELIGARFIDLILESEREGILDYMASVAAGTGGDTSEHRAQRPDGTLGWVQWTTRAIRDTHGQVLEFQGIGRDVTERKLAEEALRASEERYRNVVESQMDMICRYLADGTLTFVNDAYCRYFKRTREQLIGSRFYDLLPEDQRPVAKDFIRSLIERPRIETIEHQVTLPDGEIGWQRWIDHVIFDESGRVIELQGIGSDITERRLAEDALRRSEEELRRSHEQIRDQAARLMTAQEEERRRISCELHDDLNQKVAALAILLSRIRHQLPPRSAALAAQLEGVQGRVNDIADDIRRVSHQLHPTVLEHAGLSAALRSFVGEIGQLDGIRIGLTLSDDAAAIPRDAALCLYRLTQEALRNVVKHSGSPCAEVELSVRDGAVHLRICDRGRGFDLAGARSGSGLGLVSMEERVRQLQGRLEIRTRPGAGTALLATIPMAAGR